MAQREITNRKPRLAVLVSEAPNSGLDARAHALFDRLTEDFEVSFAYHQGSSFKRIGDFLDVLRTTRPDLIYLLDPIYAAAAATWLYRATRRAQVIVDTGDLVYQVAREMGYAGWARLAIVKWAEQTALRMAHAVIVRGSFHRELLFKQGYSPSSVTFIPDGVDLNMFHPMDGTRLRAQFGLCPNEIVIGGVGTIDWSPRRQICFGWELIEALPLVRDMPVKGILVGDGNGRALLEARAKELGVADRIVFMGRLPYADLPRAINAMDICLLTQLNAPWGWVRTTGKLPLYLACDRYVIASRVGEAARVLESCGMLLPYVGAGRDAEYPPRLAVRIRDLVEHPERLRLNGRGVQIARQYFDYDRLAQTLREVLAGTLNHVT